MSNYIEYLNNLGVVNINTKNIDLEKDVEMQDFSNSVNYRLSKITNIGFNRKFNLTERSSNIVIELSQKFNEYKNEDTSIIKPILLQALSGEGKTTIAVEFAHKYGSQFIASFWIDASKSIKEQFIKVAKNQLQLDKIIPIQHKNEEELNEFFYNAVKEYINTHSVLLMFDNVEKLQNINDFLPKTGKSRAMLLTNDLSIKSPFITKIEIPKLTDKDALEILLIGLSPTEEDIKVANEIIDFLGYLPFAIELANSILFDENMSFSYFLNHLKQESIKWEGLERKDGLNFVHTSPTIIALIGKKFSLLKDNDAIHNLARIILSCLGCMSIANDEFSIKEIKQGVDVSDDNSESVHKFNQANKILLQLGIEYDSEKYLVHTLTLEYINLFLVQKNILFGYIDVKLRDMAQWIRYQVTMGFWILLDKNFESINSLINYLIKHFSIENSNDINAIVHFFVELCGDLDFFDNTDDCLKYVELGLFICQKDRDVDYFEARNNELLVWKAISLHKQEHYDKALDIYKKIIETGKLKNPDMFINILMYAGDIYRLKKNKDNAIKCYEHALFFIDEFCKKRNLLKESQHLIQKTKVLWYFYYCYKEFDMINEKESIEYELETLMNRNLLEYEIAREFPFPNESYLVRNEFTISQLIMRGDTHKPASYAFKCMTITENIDD